jgi:hypothetical protein
MFTFSRGSGSSDAPGRREGTEEERVERARKAAAKRHDGSRERGRGHPTTAEMDYTPAELAFMKAIEAWKKRTGRQFPTWCEVLSVIVSLGYFKADESVHEAPPESRG